MRSFFETFAGTDYLSEVKAVAMDMNASYNTLVRKYLPCAEIVWDRYHVQTQYSRDVLGQVRLEAARSHNEKSKMLSKQGAACSDEAKSEKRLYSRIKKARWVLLQNYDKLSDEKAKN